MTEDNAALSPLAAIMGTWSTEATHPQFEGMVTGSTTFEWLEGERFVIVRSRLEHEMFPDAISIIGPPESGEGLVLEYFDSRGVRRTYETSVADGVWRWHRDASGFDQRYEAELDPNEFVGAGELARTPGAWEPDLRVVYRRGA